MQQADRELASDILIVGGTGNLGREVVGQLVRGGVSTRILVRDTQKASELRQSGLEVAPGDLGEPATLGPALEGISTVFLLSSDDPRQAELQGNLVEAAKRVGVSRVVKISAYVAKLGGRGTIGRWHAQTERRIEESGMAFTHLRPFYFMQNFLEFAPTIASHGGFYAPVGSSRIAMVDARDVAAVAAKVLTEGGHEGKTYEISGPEALSFEEAAARLSTVLGRTVAYVDVTIEAALEAMVSSGVPRWYAEALVELYDLLREGYEDSVTPILDNMGVATPRTLEEFVRDHAEAFKVESVQGG